MLTHLLLRRRQCPGYLWLNGKIMPAEWIQHFYLLSYVLNHLFELLVVVTIHFKKSSPYRTGQHNVIVCDALIVCDKCRLKLLRQSLNLTANTARVLWAQFFRTRIYVGPHCFNDAIAHEATVFTGFGTFGHRTYQQHPNVQFGDQKPWVKCIGQIELAKDGLVINAVCYRLIHEIAGHTKTLQQNVKLIWDFGCKTYQQNLRHVNCRTNRIFSWVSWKYCHCYCCCCRQQWTKQFVWWT